MASAMQNYTPVPTVTASGNVCPRQCSLGGIFVSSASSTPTIAVYDSATTTTSDVIVDVFTPVAGTFYPLPVAVRNGVYVVISGTVTCTVFVA